MAQKPTLNVLYLVQIRYICVLRHKSHTKLNGTPGARVCIAFSTCCTGAVLYLAHIVPLMCYIWHTLAPGEDLFSASSDMWNSIFN
jgi:hypothetical protein